MGVSTSSPVVTPGSDKVLKFSNKRRYIWYFQEVYSLYEKRTRDIAEIYARYGTSGAAFEEAAAKVSKASQETEEKMKIYFGNPWRPGSLPCNHPHNRRWACECDILRYAREKQEKKLKAVARWQAKMSDRNPWKILSSEELKNPKITTDKNGVNRRLIELIREELARKNT